MKVYLAHSSNCDYINKIYKPILADPELSKIITLPHMEKDYMHNRNYYEDFDLVIAEVSNPSTGMGIELGFFYDEKKPIYCLYQGDYSKSIEVIAKKIIEYNDIIKTIKDIIKENTNETYRI